MIWLWGIGVFVVLFGLVAFRGAPYVPSQKKYVRQAFSELYPLSHKDTLVDVGSGDGIVLRVASKCGARAIGYEINPLLVLISRFISRHDKNVEVKLVDFWLTQLPDRTTVVYAFAATPYIKKMIHKMQCEANRLQRPLRYISYGNVLAGLEADASVGAYRLYTFYPLQSS
ncbi:class I SAM-dependent methyltransferase [Candidatus Saccharibacteria bacterium]|nr:class I SAM-dependent methyltransferase [Candidatus Saccharibacteria bacterium]